MRNHNDTIKRATRFLEKYTSHIIWKGWVCERELETKQNCNILTPTLMAISVVSFSFSRAAQPEARGPAPLGAGFLNHILSPTGLVSKQTDFLSSPSYIIVQSPTQYLPITGHRNVSFPPSLEWHVWSSSSGNNCHAVHRSLPSGASVCECNVGFYLVPYCQPSPPTRSLPITGHRNVSLPPSLEWHVWPGRMSIYNTMRTVVSDCLRVQRLSIKLIYFCIFPCLTVKDLI